MRKHKPKTAISGLGIEELHQSQDTNVLRQLHQFTQVCPDYKLWLGATYGGQNTVKTCVKMSLPLYIGGIGVTKPAAVFMWILQDSSCPQPRHRFPNHRLASCGDSACVANPQFTNLLNGVFTMTSAPFHTSNNERAGRGGRTFKAGTFSDIAELIEY